MRPNLPSKDRGRVQAGVTPTPDSRVFVGVSGHAGILSGNTPPSPSTAAKCGALGDAVGRRGFSRKAGVVRKNEVSPGRLAYFAYFASFAPGSARRMRAGRPPVGRRSLSQPNRGASGGNKCLGAGYPACTVPEKLGVWWFLCVPVGPRSRFWARLI